MHRHVAFAMLLLGAAVLGGCGDDDTDDGLSPWQHARIEGLSGATGMTVADGDLVFVSGADDRDLKTVAVAALRNGASTKARTLAVTIRPGAPVHGSSPFALQDYRLEHLWKVPVDFQGVGFQPPNLLYVGERHRRLVFWGKLRRDAAGVLASVKLEHMAAIPGAKRTGADGGDWRDHGSGLRGLVAVKQSARNEDLWVVDAGTADEPIMVRRLNRYGSNFHGIRARHTFEVAPDVRAVSHDGTRLMVLLGKGRGRLVSLTPPPRDKLDSVPLGAGVPGPAIDGVDGWTGMAHADDGTIYLVSGGSPAIVAWRRP